MPDPKKSGEPSVDPFLEFPSEEEDLSDLARRLRDGKDGQAAAPHSRPEGGWAERAGHLVNFSVSAGPGEGSASVPAVRPVAKSELTLTPGNREPPKAAPDPGRPPPVEPPASAFDELAGQVRARSGATRGRRFLAFVMAAAVVVTGAGYYWVTSGPPGVFDAPEDGATANATITSRPDGATVVIDGVERGETPLTLSLPVGEYGLELRRGESQASLPLSVEAETTVSAHVELADAAPPPVPARAAVSDPGWLSVDLPVDLYIRENGRVIGTTAAERLMLPAGRHQLELMSEALEFRALVSVIIAPGRTSTASVTLPAGSVWISAWPWANVSVDGQAVGVTPLGALSLPIGEHEVVWTHPRFGERRRTITVTAQTPVRVGVDFTQ